MAKKLTKRKAFNFLRSYFDVLNEIPEDKDKLEYLLAIINKQFLDEDPKDLSFIANLCFESQRHSIESSVNGWVVASKTDLLGNPIPPTTPPKGSTPPTPSKEEQEKEKEKEKEEVKDKEKKETSKQSFEIFWDLYNKKVDKKKTFDKWKKLSQKEIDEIIEITPKYVEANSDSQYRKNPLTFLNGRCWEDEIQKETKQSTNIDDPYSRVFF